MTKEVFSHFDELGAEREPIAWDCMALVEEYISYFAAAQ